MATSTFHLRTLDEPTEFNYFGEIVGYGENTITVEYDPDNLGELQYATFMEVQNGQEVDSAAWNQVHEGLYNSIYMQTEQTSPPVEPPVEPEEQKKDEKKDEEPVVHHTPPRRKTE